MNDVPYLNENDIRGLMYINEINQELNQKEAATISQLRDNSDWPSTYYTNLWNKLAPQLVNREKDGNFTRLSLTDAGEEAVSHYTSLNIIFEEVGL